MRPGDVVADRFVVRELAGSGGMGSVYRAHDRELGADVALKILHQTSLHDHARFVREAHILQQLSHPRIVRHFAHGLCDSGMPYLVMEWLPGTNLSLRLREGPLSVPASVGVALGTAQALAAAHASGVIHRDVKPNNLIYPTTDPSAVKLLDFGIARQMAFTHGHTERGALLGTPGYLAPEQARGELEVDARADIFSLGCVLFECLTGRAAFSANHLMALLAKLVFEDAPRASELCDEISPALDDLLCRMLSKDPAERPLNAQVLLEELESIHAALARPATVGPRSSRRLLTHHEQRLVSVVAAAGQTHDTLDPRSSGAQSELMSLGESLARLGTRLERLADGSLICALTDPVATDLARRAARCGLLLNDWFPGAPVVITTGRGLFAGRLPVGEAIDRAVNLIRSLKHRSSASQLLEPVQVHLDELSADLLDARFDVRRGKHSWLLVGEADPIQGGRTLLGKTTPCVGRERELGFLQATFAECQTENSARVTLMTGAPGVGKSRLVAEFAARLASEPTPKEIWFARADMVGARSPFALLGQLVRHAAGLRGGEPSATSRRKLRARANKSLGDADVQRVAEFLGEVSGLRFGEVGVELSSARGDSALMGGHIERAWCEFVSAACQAHPLLIVLDDLQWGDLPSVKLVGSALTRLADRPLMVLGLARPSVHDAFPNLWNDVGVEELRLSALSVKASQRLVEAALGHSVQSEVVSAIVRRAEGNAFYLEELIRAVAAGRTDLPDTVLSMTQARLDALDADARRVLRAASVFGETFWKSGVLGLLGGKAHENELGACLSRLRAEELILPHADTRFAGEEEFAFQHALVRDAAYAALTERDRELGHRLAARWLLAAGESDATRLAQHYESGAQPAQAAAWYRQAAAQALDGSDLDLAIERARRAMACGAEGELLGELYIIEGEAHSWRGQTAEAEQCGTRALPLLPKGGPAWCWGAGATFMLRTQLGDVGGAVEILNELGSVSPMPDATTPYVKGCALAVGFLCYAGMYDNAKSFLLRIDELAQKDPDTLVQAWAEFARSFVLAFCDGRVQAFHDAVQTSLRHFERAGDARGQTVLQVSLGTSQRVLAQFPIARETLVNAERSAKTLGLELFSAAATLQLGIVHGELAEHPAAQRLQEQAADEFARQGNQIFAGLARTHAARSLLALGDVRRAAEQAEAALEELELAPPFRALAASVLAEVSLAQKLPSQALPHAREARQLLAELGCVAEGEAHIRLTHARALHAAGLRQEAEQAIHEARERLLARASDVKDPNLRRQFLHKPALHARTFELAQAWLNERGR
ncbi:MAG TPA: protein kinase [Polyangiaceae bacterium]|nr:protein kinase [Polyangiaceae bacterium]